jgi:hypothetical protein
VLLVLLTVVVGLAAVELGQQVEVLAQDFKVL